MNRLWLGLVLWLPCVLAMAADAPAVRATALQRSRVVAPDAELFRLREQPRAELQRLEAEQRATCQARPTSADCSAKTRALNEARPALLKRIEFATGHAPAAPRPGGGCQTCHAGPGSAPAQDPISPGLQPPGGGGGGGKVDPQAIRCFIATAAYGSPHAAEVQALRRLRDEQLLPHAWGRRAVEGYYQLSPPAAAYIAERPALRAAVRAALTPVVFAVHHPAAVLAALLGAALLAALVTVRRRVRRS